jgi:hypothetical protein
MKGNDQMRKTVVDVVGVDGGSQKAECVDVHWIRVSQYRTQGELLWTSNELSGFVKR